MIHFIGPDSLIDTSELYLKSSISDCLEYFSSKPLIQVDTETTHFNPREGRIVMLQLGYGDTQYVIDSRYTNIFHFKKLLEDKLVYGHNIGFDYKWLKHNGIVLNKLYDTMIAEMVLYCGFDDHPVGLDATVMRYLGVKLNKDIRHEFSVIGSNPFAWKHIKYGAEDVMYLEKVRAKQDIRAEEYNLHRTIRLENRAIIPLAEIEYNGMYLNKKEWLDYEKEVEKQLRQIEVDLDHMLVAKTPSYYAPQVYTMRKGKRELTPFVGAGLFGELEAERFTAVNWNSDQQVKKILKQEFNFEVFNKEGKPTINSVILGKTKNKPDIVKKLIDYAEKAKELSTYGKSFIEQYLQSDNRIRTSFWQIKATGRVSSGHKEAGAPNTQNIPQKHREFIEAPAGRKLVICDFSQQEPRITAEYCKDPKLLDFVLHGDGDSHSLVASAVFSKIEGREVVVNKKNNPYSDKFKMTYREVGKQINLGLDYGKTAFSVKDDLGVTQEEAQEFIDALKAAFPLKEKFFDEKKKDFWDKGYILHDNVIFRKTFKEEWGLYKNFDSTFATKEEKSRYFKAVGGLERDCQNYPIQGTGASMTKLALIYIHEEFIKQKLDAFLINTVHDEIVAEASNEDAEKAGEVMVECMLRAGQLFCKTVPMKVDPVISQKWIKD